MSVKTNIIKIGNSQGIRIPKPLLEQVGLSGEVELEVQADTLLVRPVRRSAREGWEEQFEHMAAQGDDGLLDGEQLNASSWDEDEWQW